MYSFSLLYIHNVKRIEAADDVAHWVGGSDSELLPVTLV